MLEANAFEIKFFIKTSWSFVAIDLNDYFMFYVILPEDQATYRVKKVQNMHIYTGQGPGHWGSRSKIDHWSAWVAPLSRADPAWRPITDPHSAGNQGGHGGRVRWQHGFS